MKLYGFFWVCDLVFFFFLVVIFAVGGLRLWVVLAVAVGVGLSLSL